MKGPHEDLETYLEAIDQLRANVRFFSSNKSFKSSDGVLNHANNLLAKAILKLEEEFRQLLSSYRLVLYSHSFILVYYIILAYIVRHTFFLVLLFTIHVSRLLPFGGNIATFTYGNHVDLSLDS